MRVETVFKSQFDNLQPRFTLQYYKGYVCNAMTENRDHF
jgi:hypothetical protein